MTRHNYITVTDLYMLLVSSGSIDYKLYILSIEYMIQNNHIIQNKYGIPCILANRGDLLYLSNLNSHNPLMSFYIQFPNINIHNNLTDIINREIYAADSEAICRLDDTIHIETLSYMLEYMVKVDRSKLPASGKKYYDKFMEKMMNRYLFRINEVELAHIFNKQNIQPEHAGYIDNIIQKDASIRCYNEKQLHWSDCEKSSKISQFIYSQLRTNIEANLDKSKGVYGRVEKGVFKIVDLTTVKKNKTTKHSITGKDCTSFGKPEIIKLCRILDIEIPDENMDKISMCNMLRDNMIENNYATVVS